MDDFTARRHRMVEEQIERRGVRDPRVLAAMGRVPREAFVPRLRLHQLVGGTHDAVVDYRDVLAEGVRLVVGTPDLVAETPDLVAGTPGAVAAVSPATTGFRRQRMGWRRTLSPRPSSARLTSACRSTRDMP